MGVLSNYLERLFDLDLETVKRDQAHKIVLELINNQRGTCSRLPLVCGPDLKLEEVIKGFYFSKSL